MTAVNVVQPTEFAVIARDTLGDRYEAVCASIHLPPTEAGYGVMMGIRPNGDRVTLLAADVAIVRDIAALPVTDRDGLAVPDVGFPGAHDGWLDLPPEAIVATHGKIARIGAAEYGLGPTRPVHPITYTEHGETTGRGYARGDELDAWRADLTADGWIVDDRAAAAPVYPAPGSEIPDQPGFVVGECTHRVAGSEWRAGFRTCERCPAGA